MRILTVCRSGGEYDWTHVKRLQEQCARFAPGIEFKCFSDHPLGSRLLHTWPGWWAKMEIFRQHGPCLYLDLDTTIVRDIEPLLMEARTTGFIVLRDVNRGRVNLHAVQSSVMAWAGDMRWLYEAFTADAERYIKEYRTPEKWGDQAFIQKHTEPERRVYWQDVLPGALVSWKKHCANGVPKDARLVFFHGKPRPWEAEM